MHEDSKELVQAATEAGVTAFLQTVAAPLVEIGGWGGDLVRRHRVRSAIKTAVLAQKWLRTAGMEAHAVPLNVLIPLLDGASLQEAREEPEDSPGGQTMHERWAALLANAASGDAGVEVMPSFPGILAELVPVEAEILELILRRYAMGHPTTPSDLRHELDYPQPPWNRPEKLDVLHVHLDNLERLRLCIAHSRGTGTAWSEKLELTVLGRAFIAACRPPTGTPRGPREV
jgi:hypothetical protein